MWLVVAVPGQLGGHLVFTRRAQADTLNARLREVIPGVATVGPLPMSWYAKLGSVRSKFPPGALPAAEASHVSVSAPRFFRAAIFCAVWSRKMRLACTPVVLALLDGPQGVVPVLRVDSVVCGSMWPIALIRFIASFVFFDLVAHGASARGPAHLLLFSAAQLGWAWMGIGEVGTDLIYLFCSRWGGPIQYLQSPVFAA